LRTSGRKRRLFSWAWSGNTPAIRTGAMNRRPNLAKRAQVEGVDEYRVFTSMEVDNTLALQRDQRRSESVAGAVAEAYDGMTALSPSPTAVGRNNSYTVKGGDTLFGIARRFGVSVAALQSANGLSVASIRGKSCTFLPPGCPTAPRVISARRPVPIQSLVVHRGRGHCERLA